MDYDDGLTEEHYQCEHGTWCLSDCDCDQCDREWRRSYALNERASRRIDERRRLDAARERFADGPDLGADDAAGLAAAEDAYERQLFGGER